jgi:hypothetical protein
MGSAQPGLADYYYRPMTTPPTRIADVISGHVHPSLARVASGDLLAVYNREGGGGKELLLCRSTDGGFTWSTPAPITAICDCSIYPGSLTTLSDGRLLLNWSCYRDTGTDAPWREPFFSHSDDDGRSWPTPHAYPVPDRSNYTCMRHPVVELAPTRWICPFYDGTLLYDTVAADLQPFGDGRNHGMVPIVRTAAGTLISGGAQIEAPVPMGRPGNLVRGLRSTDSGSTWQPLNAFPHFGVAGYDLTVLDNGWIVFTAILYGVGVDGEFAYELFLSHDDGQTWDTDSAIVIYDPGRRIGGRGWPRTVQIDSETLGTLFYDLSPQLDDGPGLFFVRTSLHVFGG